jgi:hypothetical protein
MDMGLSDLLQNSQRNTTSDDQGAWRIFILDHLDYIAKYSKTYDIDAPLMNQYRYNLNHFLREHLQRREDIGWIVLLLNSLHNDFEFFETGHFVIPQDKLITDLYHSYITIQHSG